MNGIWSIAGAALLALGLAVPMAQTASSEPGRGGAYGNVGPRMGGGGGGAMGRGGAYGNVGPRMSAPRGINRSPSMGGPRVAPPRNNYSPPRYRGPNGNGNWKGNGAGHWKGGNWKGNHRHGRKYRGYRGGYYGYSLPYYYDYYGYGYSGGDCAWLWRRWLQTGNPKWKYR